MHHEVVLVGFGGKKKKERNFFLPHAIIGKIFETI